MNRLRILRVFAVLLVGVQFLLTWMPARAEEMTCPEHTLISIDIKPGGYPNTVKLSSRGILAVAVLTTDNFDASLFTPEMAHLFDAASMNEDCMNATDVRWAREDVSDDGRPDLVFFFNIQSLDFTTSTTAATLMAHGSYGADTLHIMGTDTVRIKN
jgi:hypothetical protein